MQITSIGIDLGKTTFHLVGLDERGKVVVKKKFSRKQLLAYTANLEKSLIGMEACSGAHFIGAVLRSQGHDARLIPAQFVKPFVKSNKNDFIDAEAIAEAVTPSAHLRRSNRAMACENLKVKQIRSVRSKHSTSIAQLKPPQRSNSYPHRMASAENVYQRYSHRGSARPILFAI
jgi:transposase